MADEIGAAHRLLNRHANLVTRGEEGLWGEPTRAGIDRVLDAMAPLSSESVFVDLGCGVLRPQIHAALRCGCRALGVELSPETVALARCGLRDANRRFPRIAGRVWVQQGDIRDLKSLAPATHVFCFDVTMPAEVVDHALRLAVASESVVAVALFRPLRRLAPDLAACLEEQSKFPTNLRGSRESHTCYVYRVVRRMPFEPPGQATLEDCGPTEALDAAIAEWLGQQKTPRRRPRQVR